MIIPSRLALRNVISCGESKQLNCSVLSRIHVVTLIWCFTIPTPWRHVDGKKKFSVPIEMEEGEVKNNFLTFFLSKWANRAGKFIRHVLKPDDAFEHKQFANWIFISGKKKCWEIPNSKCDDKNTKYCSSVTQTITKQQRCDKGEKCFYIGSEMS